MGVQQTDMTGIFGDDLTGEHVLDLCQSLRRESHAVVDNFQNEEILCDPAADLQFPLLPGVLQAMGDGVPP